MRARCGALLIAVCSVVVRAEARAQSSDGARAARREILERVIAGGDTGQSAAVLLPTGYTVGRRWPVLFVLDPRGRAMLGLERFADAADRLGYVVVSSYDSRSDSTGEVNVRAMNALLSTAQGRFSIDTTRMYLAGFSGTARQVWDFAAELPTNVAGVLGFGAGLSNLGEGFARAFGGGRVFAYVGGAGDADFNYVETRAFAAQLRVRKVSARFIEYRGAHEWPPAAICGAALEWMHARAMLAGRIQIDSAFVASRIAAELDSARSLERRGQLALAAVAFGGISDDYAGWSGAREANARREALESERAVREYFARSAALAQADRRQATELERELLLARGRSVSAEQLLERFHVTELQRQAATGDTLAAPGARRLLARIHVALAFYEPHASLAKGAPRAALVMLAAASRIAPLAGESCALLARAHALAPADHPELRCASP